METSISPFPGISWDLLGEEKSRSGHSAEPGAPLSIEKTDQQESQSQKIVGCQSSFQSCYKEAQVQTRDFRVLVFLEVQYLCRNSVPHTALLASDSRAWGPRRRGNCLP